jgi:hypothetical protein
MMATVCISVDPRAAERAGRHFAERGVTPVQFFAGLHAERLGLAATKPYQVDNPGTDYKISKRVLGCWLSHRALWAALQLLNDEHFLVLEDDARFPEGWRARFDRALADAGDFDVLYVGSCCCGGKPRTRVAGEVYELRWPMCTHAYVVRRHALAKLIETTDEVGAYAPIDLSLMFHSLPKLRTLTVLPRIVDQHDKVLLA